MTEHEYEQVRSLVELVGRVLKDALVSAARELPRPNQNPYRFETRNETEKEAYVGIVRRDPRTTDAK